MKKKLANLLRRWASKLSPDNTTRDQVIADAMMTRTTADVKIFRAAHHYTRYDLQALEDDPDMALVMDMNARRKLLDDIALAMYQAGAITFHTEPEACPDSHDVIIATCRAVVKRKISQEIALPFTPSTPRYAEGLRMIADRMMEAHDSRDWQDIAHLALDVIPRIITKLN